VAPDGGKQWHMAYLQVKRVFPSYETYQKEFPVKDAAAREAALVRWADANAFFNAVYQVISGPNKDKYQAVQLVKTANNAPLVPAYTTPEIGAQLMQ
jgi:hypothetical protein